ITGRTTRRVLQVLGHDTKSVRPESSRPVQERDVTTGESTALRIGGRILGLGLSLMAAEGATRVGAPPPNAEVAPRPRGYLCYRALSPIVVDGKLDEAAWENAPWTEEFIDIEGHAKPKPTFRTRAKMLWDDRYLYIGAFLQEPHVWATLTTH